MKAQLTITRAQLGRAVRDNAGHVIQQCRRLKTLHASGAVRARLAQLAEYAELLAEQGARGAMEPIGFAGQLEGME